MLKIVRQGMVENIYVNSDIRKVSFIGTRLDTVVSTGAPTMSSDKPTGISAVAIGLICAGSVIAVLLAALVVRRRRKKAEDENMMKDMIFVDATVEAKEIAAQESVNFDRESDDFDRESPGSLAEKDELEFKQDPIIEARAVTKEDSYDPLSSQITTEDIPISPFGQDFSPDDQDYRDSDPTDLDEYERYDVDSVDSSLASLAATDSTASSVPYESLANESNDPEHPPGGEPEEAIDRLNAISETEPTISEDDDDESRSSEPNVREIV